MGGAASLTLLLGITGVLFSLQSGEAFKLIHLDQNYSPSQDTSGSSRWRNAAEGAVSQCSWACEGQTEVSRDDCMAACVLMDQQQPQQPDQQPRSASHQLTLPKTAARRQADELLVCIEANCADHINYKQCILNQCIVRGNLGYIMKEKRGFVGGALQAGSFQSGSLRDFPEVDASAMSKRGWDDPTDSCIEYHCADNEAGTLIYQLCLSKWCRGKR